MNQPIDPTFIPFPTPSAAGPHVAGAQDIAANGANQTAHKAVATTAGGGRGGAGPAEDSPGAGSRRGRPSGCSDRVVAMMKGLIRQHGFSDTAAAEGVGVSSTTISRWKKEDPELAAELLKTRFECRIHHLEIVENAAAAENGRGWRASTWMLERLFPGDYSPKMKERFAYMNLQEKIQYREESDLVYDDVKIRLAKEKAQRAQAASEAAATAQASAEEPGPQVLSVVEGHPHPHDPNREAARFETSDEHGTDEPTGEDAASPFGSTGRGRPDSLKEGATAEGSCIYSEGDSRNSRNSGAAEPGFVEAARSEMRDEHGANEHTEGSGASRDESTGRGRPDSLEAAATAEGSCIYSEGDSRNSRNSEEPEHGTPAPGARQGGDGRGGPDEPACIEAPGSPNCAILPETPGGAARTEQPAASRLSRRERRAEERRNARAQRVHART